MSDLAQFFSGMKPPKTLVNSTSAGGSSVASISTSARGTKQILSGALTAGVYKEVLAVTGGGYLNLCLCDTADTTSRQISMKIVIDGVTVYDATSDAIITAGKGLVGVGYQDGAAAPIYDIVPFNASLSISLKSTLSETDKVRLGVVYKTA